MEKSPRNRFGRFFLLWMLVAIFSTQIGLQFALGQEFTLAGLGLALGLKILFSVPLLILGWYLYNKSLESDHKNNISFTPFRNIFLPWPTAAIWLSILILIEFALVTSMYAYRFFPCSGFDAIRKLDGCIANIDQNHFIDSMAFSNDGKLFAISEFDGPVQIWSYPAMTLISNLGDQWFFGTDISFSSNGEMIAICGYEAPTSIVETKTGKVLRTLVQYNKDDCGVVFASDDKLVISASKAGLQIWDAVTGKLVNSVVQDDLHYLKISPDGSFLATGNYKGKISIRRVADGAILATLEGQPYLQSMIISSDGNYLMTINWDIKSMASFDKDRNSTIYIWNIKNGEIERKITLQDVRIAHISSSRNGSGFAVGEKSCFGKNSILLGKRCAYFWQTMDAKTPIDLNVADGVTSITFSLLDNRILVGTADGIYIWQKP